MAIPKFVNNHVKTPPSLERSPIKRQILKLTEDFRSIEDLAVIIECSTTNIRLHMSQLRLLYGYDYETVKGEVKTFKVTN